MSDYLTRGFRAQLTTTMDSVLRRAVFEIMTIFENTLHDHRMELAQKGEEVAQLKIKLQTAELKLKDYSCGDDGEAAVNKSPTKQKQKEPEDSVDTPGQTSRVPEIDFEVPDDWCAPLGCEIATKQDEGVCPSVRLRPFSIPLWHIPIVKHEVENDGFQDTSGGRRSKRHSTGERAQETTLPLSNQRTRRLPVRNDMKRLLQDNITNTYSYQPSFENLKRKAGKEQENTEKSNKRKRKDTATKSKSPEEETEENDKNMYCCRYCKKMFDTEFGRDVHARMHKTCRGCKKIFPLAGALRNHKRSCVKLQKLLAKQAAKNVISKTTSDEEKTPAPSKRQEITQKESTSSSRPDIKLSIQKNKSTKKHLCTYCNKVFDFRYKLQQHMLIHTGEKPFPCSICPSKYRLRQSLKMHMKSKHNLQKNSNKTNRDLAWTNPLEETEDNRDRKDTHQEIRANRVLRKSKGDEKTRWQTMGKRCNKGFTCLLCEKLVKNRRVLIEHFRLHTGERPLSCDKCPEKFRTKAQLYMHKKKCS